MLLMYVCTAVSHQVRGLVIWLEQVAFSVDVRVPIHYSVPSPVRSLNCSAYVPRPHFLAMAVGAFALFEACAGASERSWHGKEREGKREREREKEREIETDRDR